MHKHEYNTTSFAIELVIKHLQIISLCKSLGLMYTFMKKLCLKTIAELIDHAYNRMCICKAKRWINTCVKGLD